MPYIKYEIKKRYGVIGESPNGWKKELNYVSWNERAPKFDIRDWEPGYRKMGKGVTLTKAEAAQLKKVLSSINFDDLDEVMVFESSPPASESSQTTVSNESDVKY